MEEKIDFSQVPNRFELCTNRECKQANTCLRHLAEQAVPARVHHFILLNPRYLATFEDKCPHYRSSAKVRYAKGFMKILVNLPHVQMNKVVDHLIEAFGRRTYYRMRKGERLISPSEQKLFFDVLKRCNASTTLDFDGYVEDYVW